MIEDVSQEFKAEMQKKKELRSKTAEEILMLLKEKGFTYKDAFNILSEARFLLEEASLRTPV